MYDRDAEGNIIYDDKGKPKYGGIASSADMAAGVTGPNVVNPVAQLETMHSRAPEMRFFSTTSFEVKPVRGLTLKSDFTADLDVLETDAFQPVIDVPGGSTTTLREQEHTRTFHYLWETTATYAEVFGKHHISAMAGFTTDYKKLRLYDFRTQNYPSDTWDKYQNLWQNGSWYRDPTENYYEYAMVSFLARLGYSFDDRYFLTASIRRDASSKLPSSKNYDWFPAVSGAWKLSSEKFFANSSLAGVFDLIKIRAGWGMVGNVDLYPNTSSVDVPLSIYPDGSLIGGNTVYGKLLRHHRQPRRHVGDDRADQRRYRPDASEKHAGHLRRLLRQGERATCGLRAYAPADGRHHLADGQYGPCDQQRLGVSPVAYRNTAGAGQAQL